MQDGATISAPASAWLERNPVHEDERRVIEEVCSAAAGLADDPAVPVARVLAGADIGDDHHPGIRCFDPPDRLLDDPFGIIGAGRRLVLVRRDAEEKDCLYAPVPHLPGNTRDPVYRVPELPGHGHDRFFGRCGLIHKQGGDEIVPGERGLAQKRLDSTGPYPPHSSLEKHVHHTSNLDDNRLQMHRIYGYIIRVTGLLLHPGNWRQPISRFRVYL